MTGSKTNVSLDHVLTQIDTGYFHVRLLIVCGLGFSAAAVEVVLTAFIFVELREAWKLTEYQLSVLPLITGSASTCGEIFWGVVADRYGRRFTFMVTVVITSLFGLASACSTNIIYFYVLRSFVGFGYGGNIAVDFALFSEFLSTGRRGEFLFYMQAFWPVGQLCTIALAWSVIPNYGWRFFVAACAVPSLLTALLRPFIPESPRWLLLNGYRDEAEVVLSHMAVLNGKRAEDVGLSKDTELTLDNEATRLLQPSKSSLGSFSGLFGPGLWRTTVGLLFVLTGLEALSYGVGTLLPTLLEKKGIAGSDIYETMLMAGLSQIPGIGLGYMLAHSVGRLRPLQLSLIPIAVAMCLFAQATGATSAAIWSCIASGSLECAWALCQTYKPEVYPTQLRATAIGFIAAGGSVAGCAIPLMSAILLEADRVRDMILMFCGIAAVCSFAQIVFLHIETKDRALHDSVCD